MSSTSCSTRRMIWDEATLNKEENKLDRGFRRAVTQLAKLCHLMTS
jgi:hypothetical protein